MLAIFITFDVLNFDKSKEFNDSQFLNIPPIFVTFFVSICEKFNDFKF